MPADTDINQAKLSQELMNYLADHKTVIAGLEGARNEIEKIKYKLWSAERVINDLTKGESLSGIVKEKNKVVVDKRGISIDYINKCLTYPPFDEDFKLA